VVVRRDANRVMTLDLKARNHMEDLSGGGNIIQKFILQQLDWGRGGGGVD